MKKWCIYLSALVFLLFSVGHGKRFLLEQAVISGLSAYSEETEDFRDMMISRESIEQLERFSKESGIPLEECFALAMVKHKFQISGRIHPDKATYLSLRKLLLKKKAGAYWRLVTAYGKIFGDLVCFPVPYSSQDTWENQVFFENGYGEARNYGGKRTHEGIDIFGKKEESSYYPVISATDGVVEKIGWLPLGGYRIGIRGLHGAYFYYAHLASYEQHFKEGDRVRAGELLGLMGDTGYGPEGTSGKFPVHLHFGIYISTEHYEELSINPYPALQLLEKHIEEYQY